jgi:hypothetical protein
MMRRQVISMADAPKESFEEISNQQRGGSLLGEFWAFLKQNKKWWLLPILLTLLVLGLLLLLSSTAAAPFIYTLF